MITLQYWHCKALRCLLMAPHTHITQSVTLTDMVISSTMPPGAILNHISERAPSIKLSLSVIITALLSIASAHWGQLQQITLHNSM